MIASLSDFLMQLSSLTVFHDVAEDQMIKNLRSFLQADYDTAEAVKLYCEFVRVIYESGSANISEYIRELVRCSSNPIAELLGEGKKVPAEMANAAEFELKILADLASLTPKKLRENLHYEGKLPEWKNSEINLAADFSMQMKNITKHGYGIYAKYRAFRLDCKKILPIEYPDPVRLFELIGYQSEKQQIISNTRALLSGKPAANILLTGDAGTGKSSTVKAVVNELADEGLRILELKKQQLHELPEVLGELNRNPLKFIIFIDDLSFTQNDDNFSALKAVLEGTVSARANNVVIYATSNRRHLIKESFSDRDGDDIHRNDTMQETVSLSERFGLHITFSKPDKSTYLDIVKHLCDEAGVEFDEIGAEQFALTRASRSARAARQYVDSLISEKY